MTKHDSFLEAVSSSHRSPEIPDSADVYGWLIGSWNLDVHHYAAADVKTLAIKGEAHFRWVLEGRAIEDVWIMPRRSERAADTKRTNNMYGTTLRVWNPAIQAWNITWINPVSGHREEQIGRRRGNDVVQEGVRPDGARTCWMFTEITQDSFHWIGEARTLEGRDWKLEGEFPASRVR